MVLLQLHNLSVLSITDIASGILLWIQTSQAPGIPIVRDAK
jgi:hypothetical protein